MRSPCPFAALRLVEADMQTKPADTFRGRCGDFLKGNPGSLLRRVSLRVSLLWH
jgi:hypothetical protein